MITFWNPFDDILHAAQRVHKDIDVKIQFDEHMRRFLFWGRWGETFFPNDSSTPVITISANLPYKHCLEILAHELAHVIVGVDTGHGNKWQKCFEEIHKEYSNIVLARQEAEHK